MENKVSHPGVEIPFGWFTNETKPFVDPDLNDTEDGLVSDLVLIDLDGNRETFVTGKYHFPHGNIDGWWDVGDFYERSLEVNNMRWSYIPLARYEK